MRGVQNDTAFARVQAPHAHRPRISTRGSRSAAAPPRCRSERPPHSSGRFRARHKSAVHANYKQAVITAGVSDTRTVGRGLGMIRAITNDFTDRMIKLEDSVIDIEVAAGGVDRMCRQRNTSPLVVSALTRSTIRSCNFFGVRHRIASLS